MFELAFVRGRALLLLVTVADFFSGAAKAEALQQRLDQAFRGQANEWVDQSVLFHSISQNQALWDRNADQLVSPASVTKVVTAAATLAKLTPGFRFKTRLFHTGERKNGIVTGDLVVVGDGDPFLTSEKIWQLSADLRHLGIREFRGNLVVDSSLFDDETRDASRIESAKRSRNAYDAPVSALGINFNTVALAVAPADSTGQPARIGVDPYPLDSLVIVNRLLTVGEAAAGLKVSRETDARGLDVMSINGKITNNHGLQKIYRSVSNANRTAGEYIKAFLAKEGIQITGKVKQGILDPAKSKFLLEVESYEMQKVIAGLNKFSNNFIADMLVKRLGAAFPKNQAPNSPGSGTLANGNAVLRDFLINDVGIKTEFQIHNGSGLSTENRLSARQVVQLLRYMESRFDLFPEFLASLPAAGWEGSLSKRMGQGEMNGTVRAKTGTLTEPITVSTLAGYLRHSKHGWVAFAILDNGVLGKRQPSLDTLRIRQDEALIALLKN